MAVESGSFFQKVIAAVDDRFLFLFICLILSPYLVKS